MVRCVLSGSGGGLRRKGVSRSRLSKVTLCSSSNKGSRTKLQGTPFSRKTKKRNPLKATGLYIREVRMPEKKKKEPPMVTNAGNEAEWWKWEVEIW